MILLLWENRNIEDLLNEVWIDVYGYDGVYSVSNFGRVKSEERRVNTMKGDRLVKSRILKQWKSKDGRLSVRLSKECLSKTLQVNQLVYYSFNPNKLGSKSKSEVYHKNKIDSDNRLINLGYNKTKGKSYKISIDLGNVKHLKGARKKLHRYTKENAIIKDGKTTHRKCKKCKDLKTQKEFYSYGSNTCKKCKNKQSKINYNSKKNKL